MHPTLLNITNLMTNDAFFFFVAPFSFISFQFVLLILRNLHVPQVVLKCILYNMYATMPPGPSVLATHDDVLLQMAFS